MQLRLEHTVQQSSTLDVLLMETQKLCLEVGQVQCEMMSLTNSSGNCKPTNWVVDYDENDPREHKDGTWLNTTIWLVTARDIQPFEESVWDYLVR